MNAPIDPPRHPVPGAALALAEAALQRQNSLLGAGRTNTTQPSVQGQTAKNEAAELPMPAVPDRISLSPQALQALGAQPVTTDMGQAAGGAAARTVASMQAGPAPRSPTPPALSLPAGAAAQATAPQPVAWPAAGVGATVQSLINSMVRQMTHGGLPQRVVSAQPWPAELVRQMALPTGPGSEAQDGALPILQTWLVRQGNLQTAEGTRPFTLTLKVPVPWLQQEPTPAAAPTQGGPLSLAYTGRPQALQAEAFALVLQSTETTARTSALLVMEFAPLAQAAVYGREMLQARQDPWLQMAVLQASGHLPRDEDLERDQEAGLCQTPGCPYVGRASCAQPFCLALQVVSPVAAVDAGATGKNDPRPS